MNNSNVKPKSVSDKETKKVFYLFSQTQTKTIIFLADIETVENVLNLLFLLIVLAKG